ncbi:hypothetical protein BT96DRAFT_268713 [Gymnopus androsaceus JB14]|uniref:Uncharacterized protein n=1 Tax=Gymnopus androsaceus JB14 TaxID=1447944 RepID=A0A6A4I8H1_9AGAR|nr:hypothetical protein BT96DRAFT_268713 [Gymnopus androsaceus JB14]
MRVRWAPIAVATLWTGAVFIALAVSPLYTHCRKMGIVLHAWVNELNGHDSEKRAFMIAACDSAGYVVQAWFNIVFFPQVEQPRILEGKIASACMNFLIAAWL